MPVDVQAFEAINLKDLLDTAKKNDADLERTKIELASIEAELAAAIESAERDYRGAMESVRAQGLGAEEEKAGIDAALKTSETKKREARNRFAAPIAAKKAQIAAIQKRIDSYDQKLTEQAKKQQEVLANERKVFEDDKKRIVKAYEAQLADLEAARIRDAKSLKKQREDLAATLTARWNPIFDTNRDKTILGDDPSRGKLTEGPAFPPYLRGAGLLDASAESRINRSYDDFLYMSKRLRAVPYINSVPPILKRMEEEARRAVSELKSLLQGSSRGLEDRDKKIAELNSRAAAAEAALERYRWSVSEFVRTNTDGGYVLDSRNPENVSVVINPAIPVVNGSLGYVFRSSERAIAVLSFTVKDGTIRARVVELAPGQRLLPFDPILVSLSGKISTSPIPTSVTVPVPPSPPAPPVQTPIPAQESVPNQEPSQSETVPPPQPAIAPQTAPLPTPSETSATTGSEPIENVSPSENNGASSGTGAPSVESTSATTNQGGTP